MTFTRVSDSETLIPAVVFGPFEQDREVRNSSRELMHSSTSRNTFSPAVNRTGEYQLLFHTYSEAKDAVDFFAEASLYGFVGPSESVGGGYVIVDGFIIDSGDPEIVTAFDCTFIVWGGALSIRQNAPMWELIVPYKEIPS